MEPIEYNRVEIGKLLQTVRKASGFTQKAAAKAVGCSVSQIISVEGGKTGLSINKLLSMCITYHITPNDLLQSYFGEQKDMDDTIIIKAMLGKLTEKERKHAMVLLSAFVNPSID